MDKRLAFMLNCQVRPGWPDLGLHTLSTVWIDKIDSTHFRGTFNYDMSSAAQRSDFTPNNSTTIGGTTTLQATNTTFMRSIMWNQLIKVESMTVTWQVLAADVYMDILTNLPTDWDGGGFNPGLGWMELTWLIDGAYDGWYPAPTAPVPNVYYTCLFECTTTLLTADRSPGSIGLITRAGTYAPNYRRVALRNGSSNFEVSGLSITGVVEVP